MNNNISESIVKSHDPTVVYRVLQIISMTGLIGLFTLSVFLKSISAEVAFLVLLSSLVQIIIIFIAIRLYMQSAFSKATLVAGIAAFTAPLIGISGCIMTLS